MVSQRLYDRGHRIIWWSWRWRRFAGQHDVACRGSSRTYPFKRCFPFLHLFPPFVRF